jgi:signal transducing adaptor molecule
MQDKGGRSNWAQYSAYTSSGAGSSSGAGPSGSGAGSSSSRPTQSSSSSYAGTASVATSSSQYNQPEKNKPSYSSYSPAYSGGYAPAAARSPSPVVQTPTSYASQTTVGPGYSSQTPVPTSSTPAPADNVQPGSSVVTRVRALHTFEPTEPGELGFEKGDIIKVVDRGYKDWWRGQLKGRTGIFPVNYVVRFMPSESA